MPIDNTFRKDIISGSPVFGARASSYSPTLIEIYGELELDYIRIDLERSGPSPWNSQYLENAARAANIADTELLVRLPNADPSLIRRVLDTGIRNLLLPRIKSVTEVRHAVRASRLSHAGKPGERSLSGWRATGYDTDVEPDAEDQSVCIGIMIETKAAVDDAEKILSVPDLDFVFMGPNDLSVQYGVPGERNNSDVTEAVRRVESLARDHSVALGAAGHDPDKTLELLDNGYQVIRLLDEFDAIRTIFAERWNVVSEQL